MRASWDVFCGISLSYPNLSLYKGGFLVRPWLSQFPYPVCDQFLVPFFPDTCWCRCDHDMHSVVCAPSPAYFAKSFLLFCFFWAPFPLLRFRFCFPCSLYPLGLPLRLSLSWCTGFPLVFFRGCWRSLDCTFLFSLFVGAPCSSVPGLVTMGGQ